jgi:hypothetical protein
MKIDSAFDRRVVQRNLKHGRLTRKEYDQYLAGLPDAAGKAVPMFSEVRASQIPAAAIDEGEDEGEDEDDEG